MPQRHRISTGNRILDALPEHDLNRLQRGLEPVALALNQTLNHVGAGTPFVYFPVRGAVSLRTTLQDESSIEVAMIGNEGLIGLSALLADPVPPHTALVQGAGYGLRAAASIVRDEFERSQPFREVVLQFAALFIAQVSQTAACNSRHGLAERCASWLLTMSDRLGADRFPLTQASLAALLGVQRTALNGVAVALQRRGVIRYHHGRIDILDRAKLAAAACECHGAIKDRLDGFLRPQIGSENGDENGDGTPRPPERGPTPVHATD